MSGPYFNGGNDDGLTVDMARLAHRLDGAREAHCGAVRENAVSPLVRALVDSLAGVDGAAVPASPVAAVAAAQGARQRGVRWDPQDRPKRGAPGTTLFASGKKYRADAQGWYREVPPRGSAAPETPSGAQQGAR